MRVDGQTLLLLIFLFEAILEEQFPPLLLLLTILSVTLGLQHGAHIVLLVSLILLDSFRTFVRELVNLVRAVVRELQLLVSKVRSTVWVLLQVDVTPFIVVRFRFYHELMLHF